MIDTSSFLYFIYCTEVTVGTAFDYLARIPFWYLVARSPDISLLYFFVYCGGGGFLPVKAEGYSKHLKLVPTTIRATKSWKKVLKFQNLTLSSINENRIVLKAGKKQ